LRRFLNSKLDIQNLVAKICFCQQSYGSKVYGSLPQPTTKLTISLNNSVQSVERNKLLLTKKWLLSFAA
jgi:hypothetical protein